MGSRMNPILLENNRRVAVRKTPTPPSPAAFVSQRGKIGVLRDNDGKQDSGVMIRDKGSCPVRVKSLKFHQISGKKC